MNSEDTIKKFENIIRLRHCIDYHPVMNTKDYACMKYLDGKRYGSQSRLILIRYYLRPCVN